MSGRFNFQNDQTSSPRYGFQSALPQRRDTALDHRVINNNPSRGNPSLGGNAAGNYTQPQTVLNPGHRGFGLMTGIPKAPENLIAEFNKDIQPSRMAYGLSTGQGGRYIDDMLSPTVTLTPDGHDFEDISLYGPLDDEMITSPDLSQSPFSRTDLPFSRTDLGIPSSQPLSRNASQTSSRLQDDTISLTHSTTSAGDDLMYLGNNYFTPGTSFSQDLQTSTLMGFPNNSPSTSGFYHGSLGHESSASPNMNISFDCDLSFSAMSNEEWPEIPKHTPQRPPQQSALSQRLADSPLPRSADVDFLPDPYFENMASEQALSAGFMRLDSQENDAGLIPYRHDDGYNLISVTPAEPLSPLDMLDPSAVDDVEGTAPGRFYPYDVSYPQMPHSFPKPQAQVSMDNRLMVPGHSFIIDQRKRRIRASSSGSLVPPAPSIYRTNTSTKPIPIPTSQPRNVRPHVPRGSPSSHIHGSRGRRKGPMEAVARKNAKRTRNEKTVCIRCRASKLKCQRPEDNPDGCCTGCEKAATSSKPTGPCTKFYFDDLVCQGSIDGNYALEMTHPAGNDQRRIREKLPSEFDFDAFIRQLDSYRNRFNLKICDGARQLYGLDLEMCFQYMSRVRESMLPREEPVTDFVTFLDKDAAHADPKTEDWMRMLTNAPIDPREYIVEFYLDIAKMSEHASVFYTMRTGDNSKENLINPAIPGQAAFLVFATRLTRIIGRKVEVAAFLQLQKEIHEFFQNQGPKHTFVEFLHRIGRFLVTLRSRITRASNSTNSSRSQPPPETRAIELCRILYSYYLFFRKKLHSSIGESWENTLKGVWMAPAPSVSDIWPGHTPAFAFQSPVPTNANGDIWHDFPVANGDNAPGFDAWMASSPEGRTRNTNVWTSYV